MWAGDRGSQQQHPFTRPRVHPQRLSQAPSPGRSTQDLRLASAWSRVFFSQHQWRRGAWPWGEKRVCGRAHARQAAPSLAPQALPSHPMLPTLTDTPTHPPTHPSPALPAPAPCPPLALSTPRAHPPRATRPVFPAASLARPPCAPCTPLRALSSHGRLAHPTPMHRPPTRTPPTHSRACLTE
jgi:hypothetical protein